jgi:VWFA-related protein
MWFFRSAFFLSPVICILVFFATSAYTQQPSPTPVEKDEVIRVNTDLMQTELMVFDKQGNFIGGLRPEQLELKVNNKPQPISFLEQVKTGSATEFAQRKKAFGNAGADDAASASAMERGRTVIFFVDDLHLSMGSFDRAREIISRFIDNEMTAKDQVIIASSSGQLGNLSQFTNDKTMLKTAVAKLIFRPANMRGLTGEKASMSEYAASSIDRDSDSRILNFYIAKCLEDMPPFEKPDACEAEVRSKAHYALQQAAAVTAGTYAAFENLLDLVSQMPGRKLSFFISDGFLMGSGIRRTEMAAQFNRIIDKARASGVVVYTVDARGLVASAPGAGDNNKPDSLVTREIVATQDSLGAIAKDTGGRALRNQNFLAAWVNKVLDETSNYYLLAWYLDDAKKAGDDLRSIKVEVLGHPEYEVRLPRGFLKNANSQIAAKAAAPPVEVPKTPQDEIKDALFSASPKKDVPLALSAFYLDTADGGLVLRAAVQVQKEALSFETKGDKRLAEVDIAGVVFDDKGKMAGNFQKRLNIDTAAQSGTAGAASETYTYRLPALKPGMYEIRVAVRDNKANTVGSARQGIELPDLASKKLTLSSLLIGTENAARNGTLISVDHGFNRTSDLLYTAYIYNAGSPADLEGQVQIMQGTQVVASTPALKIAATAAGVKDPARIPFEDAISLSTIPPGRYTLQVKVTDRATKAEAVQQTEITVK